MQAQPAVGPSGVVRYELVDRDTSVRALLRGARIGYQGARLRRRSDARTSTNRVKSDLYIANCPAKASRAGGPSQCNSAGTRHRHPSERAADIERTPVTTMGPSAPNGPPVPMAMAADMGLATAVRGAMRLCRVSTDSMASGMP